MNKYSMPLSIWDKMTYDEKTAYIYCQIVPIRFSRRYNKYNHFD